MQAMERFILLVVICAISASLASCQPSDSQNVKDSSSIQDPTKTSPNSANDELIVLAHRAYRYDSDAYFEPKPKTKLVAIEIEIKNGGPWVDLDDFELVDVEKQISLGDFPDIQEVHETPDLVRLIYQVPEATHLVQLRFGGSPLLNEPIQISE